MMSLIRTVGQISRLSSCHQSFISVKPCKTLFCLKGSTLFSPFTRNIHIVTQIFRHQASKSLFRNNLKKGFPVKIFNEANSRTFFSSLCGKQIVWLIKPLHISVRFASTHGNNSSNKNQTALIYVVAIFIFMIGAAYAGVPLYKVFCQATGLGGQAISKAHEIAKIESMQKVDRQIKIRFNADVASSMRWNFKPQQTEVTVLPGETALAFYTAMNPTDKPIIGISTYNVLPYDAGQYFNKIQCFCFEEQRLNPKEQVDMPVFFYIDPEFAEDPKLENVKIITLSYTFFEAKEGLQLPLPGYPQPHDPVVST